MLRSPPLFRAIFLLFCLGTMIMTTFQAHAVTCQGDVYNAVAAGSLPNYVTLDRGTTGQPLGGTLTFTVPTQALSNKETQLTVCFRWRPRDADAAEKLKNNWSMNVPIRVLDSKTDLTTFSVDVPHGLPGVRDDWANYYEYSWPWWRADCRILVAGAQGTPVLDEIIPISITGYWLSASTAVVVTLAFWMLVYYLSRWGRSIRGGFILSVVCNPNGYASLSQFQIMLWTVVIGLSSIYVMMLTGRLLDIPTQTLSLLGIAGAATVAAAVPKAGSGADGGGSTPGAVTRLRTIGQPGTNSCVLAWALPSGGEAPTSYMVMHRTPPGTGAWLPAPGGGAVPETLFEIKGLSAGTPYEFQVVAANANGPGPGEQTPTITTAVSGGAVAARPLQVQPLRFARDVAVAKDHVTIQWDTLVPGPEAYVVSFRRSSGLVWRVFYEAPASATNAVVNGLSPGTDYKFQVSAVAGGQVGPASTILSARTASRIPEYTDLLVWDGTGEVDVSRLQMLLFTLIAAIFVSAKVVAENEIPSISEGLMLLMGLSNGVYVTSKYVTGRRYTAPR